ITIADSVGHTIGYADSAVITGIPGAAPVIPRVGGFQPPIGYHLPAGGNYSVVMTGYTGTTSQLGFFSDSTIFSYYRLAAQPGETDRLRVGNGFDFANRDAGVKHSYLETVVVHPSDDLSLGLWNASVAGNDSVHFDVVNRQNLHVVNTGDSLSYDLHLEHASANEAITFSHAGLAVPSHSAAQIVPPWGRMQNTPVKILIDRGNTGNYTDSLFVYNQTSGWNADSSVNTAVCLAPGWQTEPMIVKDGTGGSIIIWQDQRKGTGVYYNPFGIYAQRVNALGWPMWTVDGVRVVEDSSSEINPRVITDGHGGAVVVWWETPSNYANPYSIRAQHIDSTGAVRWAPGGVIMDNYTTNFQEFFSAVSDGHGGVIVAAENFPSAPADVFAQRIDSAGTVRWGAHGVALAPGGISAQSGVVAAPDSAGGAVCVWNDNRYGGTDSAGALFMQRVDASGNLLWGQGGMKLNNHTSRDFTILSHRSGDYIVSWSLNPRQTGPQVNMITAQRVDGNGHTLWQTNGVPVTTTPTYSQIIDDIIDDRRGGAIICWEQGLGGGEGVAAERLDSTGTRQWLASGIPLVTGGPAYYRLPQMVENGHGGALVIWQDYRNATVDPNNVDIFGQGIGADGSLAFKTNGIPVTAAPKAQQYASYFKRGIALTDTMGTAVVAWEDGRSAPDPGQIYASRFIYPYTPVTGIGALPAGTPSEFRLDQNYPNPFNPTTTIGYRLPAWEHVSLSVYNILGQHVRTLVEEDQAPGEHRVQFNGTGLASGVYFYRLHAGNFIQARKFVMVK
ncbi:MAG TPA: T9SS type A sorting domain-containing protein, partial [Bacteroidota bacterium]|nr:T9SS type A sorting domain-containing protein [Bacteroidota bacterium]